MSVSGSNTGQDPSDAEALLRHHQFVRDDSKDENDLGKKWELRMTRKYYDNLYKEYVIADMSRYQEGKLGLRWRSRKEVLAGIGTDMCGALGCGKTVQLKTLEVPFKYAEAGESKSELVKLRLCRTCAERLRNIYRSAKLPAESSPKKRRRIE